MPNDPLAELIEALRNYDKLSEIERKEVFEEAASIIEDLTAPPLGSAIFSKEIEGLDGPLMEIIASGNTRYFVPPLKGVPFERGDEALINLSSYGLLKNLGKRDTGVMASVSEILEGNRALVSTGQQSQFIVDYEDGFDINAASRIRLDPSSSFVVEVLPVEKSLDYCIERDTNVLWSDIGGMEDTIEEIRNTIELPTLDPEGYDRYNLEPQKGFLLYGPPGCGKTHLVRALVTNMFEETKEKGETPAVIVFWDEADSLFASRGSGVRLSSGGSMSDTVVPQFLSLLDGVEELSVKRNGNPTSFDRPYFFNINGPEILNMWIGETEKAMRSIYESASMYANGKPIITVLASNRPDKLDPAVTRDKRIGKKIEVPRPNKEAGRQIFDIHFKQIPISRSFVYGKGGYVSAREEMLDIITDKVYEGKPVAYAQMESAAKKPLYATDFISGARIEGIVNAAAQAAFLRSVSGGREGVTMDDMDKALTDSLQDDIRLLVEGQQSPDKFALIFGGEDADKMVRITSKDNGRRGYRQGVI